MATPLDIDWRDDRPLHLSGPPGSWRVPVAVHNPGPELLTVAGVSLGPVTLAGGELALRGRADAAPLTLPGHATARTRLRLQVDPTTPPGTYEGTIEIGGVTRALRIDIVEQANLHVEPAPVVIDAAAGPSGDFAVAVENRGNVPLTVDFAGAHSLGEESPLADPHARLAELASQLTGSPRREPLREIGRIGLTMAEGALRLDPGQSATTRVGFQLPEGLDPTLRYRAFIPLYAATLELVVVTAEKPTARAKPVRSAAKRGQS